MKAKRAIIIACGVLVALVMAGLGLWQMQVFEDQGRNTAAERARSEPIPLLSQVDGSNDVGDVYGRPVTASGTFLPAQQLLVRDAIGDPRVLAALRLPDGRVLAVVLGTTSGQAPVARGDAAITGVFLASEATPDEVPALKPGEVAAVRLPELAQRWPQRLLPGYVTLGAEEAATHGLAPAPLNLPSSDGSARNSGYAIQWWVFAAFAIGISIKIARDVGRPPAKPSADLPDAQLDG